MKCCLFTFVLAAGACLSAATLPSRSPVEPQLAIYYSFDTAPPPTVVNEMQAELGRILAPTDLRVTWRDLSAGANGGETFREVVILRLRGNCALNPSNAQLQDGLAAAGNPLAETELAEGKVLSFGEVACDQLRKFIGPVATVNDASQGSVVLGRAVARVAAHEIYHMLTGSGEHSKTGIFRAEHSRAELIEAKFDFARADIEWLKQWADRPAGHQLVTTNDEPAPGSIAAIASDEEAVDSRR